MESFFHLFFLTDIHHGCTDPESPLMVTAKQVQRDSRQPAFQQINDQPAAGSQKHCTVHLTGDGVVLTNCSTAGTYVDTTKVSQTALLQLGETLRLDTSGEELKLIACIKTDET